MRGSNGSSGGSRSRSRNRSRSSSSRLRRPEIPVSSKEQPKTCAGSQERSCSLHADLSQSCGTHCRPVPCIGDRAEIVALLRPLGDVAQTGSRALGLGPGHSGSL